MTVDHHPKWVWTGGTNGGLDTSLNVPTTPSTTLNYPLPDIDHDFRVLAHRLSTLGIHPTMNLGITVRKLPNGTRVILVINGDQWTTIEDGPELYPSDALVTAIRIMLK